MLHLTLICRTTTYLLLLEINALLYIVILLKLLTFDFGVKKNVIFSLFSTQFGSSLRLVSYVSNGRINNIYFWHQESFNKGLCDPAMVAWR